MAQDVLGNSRGRLDGIFGDWSQDKGWPSG